MVEFVFQSVRSGAAMLATGQVPQMGFKARLNVPFCLNNEIQLVRRNKWYTPIREVLEKYKTVSHNETYKYILIA